MGTCQSKHGDDTNDTEYDGSSSSVTSAIMNNNTTDRRPRSSAIREGKKNQPKTVTTMSAQHGNNNPQGETMQSQFQSNTKNDTVQSVSGGGGGGRGRGQKQKTSVSPPFHPLGVVDANNNCSAAAAAAAAQNGGPKKNSTQQQKSSTKQSQNRGAGPVGKKAQPVVPFARKSTEKTKNGVHFADFKDREKNMVDTLLESNRSLRMASVGFHDLKLIKIIGTGAFGEVIKGTYCGTPVVVKRILRNKIDENNLRMFAEEIQLMMNLRHPNIVQFIGASWNSYSNVCFVTEYMERGDLFSVLRNPKYKLNWADHILRMMIDTSRGMAYLHSMKPPIIHRDLKSMNILVGSTFTCKVSDFGLSREKSVDETMSVTGTPLWLPPEMIRGERYTEKADVYSFGIVMSEFDTRKIPYHDIKAKGARNKKVSGSTLMHMVAYENLRPSLSKHPLSTVSNLYQRCTSDDALARPTFEEIVQELDGPIRRESVQRAHADYERNIALSSSPVQETENNTVSAEELGVLQATKYDDESSTPENSF